MRVLKAILVVIAMAHCGCARRACESSIAVVLLNCPKPAATNDVMPDLSGTFTSNSVLSAIRVFHPEVDSIVLPTEFTPPMRAPARELFDRIKIGMTRSEVESLLGSPRSWQLHVDGYAWYLSPPQIESWQSPFAQGTIGIQFTVEGKVAAKQFNNQGRQPR